MGTSTRGDALEHALEFAEERVGEGVVKLLPGHGEDGPVGRGLGHLEELAVLREAHDPEEVCGPGPIEDALLDGRVRRPDLAILLLRRVLPVF